MHWNSVYPKLNKRPTVEIVTPVEQQRKIPKILHQIYFSDRPMSEELKTNVEAIKALNPAWEHRLYDDKAMRGYITTHYEPAVLAHYDRLNPEYGAALADLFRYLLLYRTGGLYLDIKSAARRPLDEVLRPDDCFLLSQWRNRDHDRFRGWGIHPEVQHLPGGEFQQWNIAAAPGHPFMKAVIENVLRNIDVYNPGLHGAGQLGVLRVTGPIAYTLAIAPILDDHPHRLVDSDRDLGLDYSIFHDERHATLFKDHYSKLDESVVRLSPWKKALSFGLQTTRGVIRRAREVALGQG